MSDLDAVIDVSNVCYSHVLPPEGRRCPAWSRLGLVMDAWRELHGSDAGITLVADDSLAQALDDADARDLLRMRERGELQMRPTADELILALARDRGLHVITRDHYVDHRREHPWIERAPDRFHHWAFTGGKVRFEPLGITPTSEQSVSRAMEFTELKRFYRINPYDSRNRGILRRRWRCGNVSCREGSQWQDELLSWPLVTDGGEARCPSCRKPVEDAGPRGPVFEAVAESRVVGDGRPAQILRFPLEPGCPVIVGRGTDQGISLQVHDLPPEADVTRVSRRHVMLQAGEAANGDRRLAATDLNSTNGTLVERWAGTRFLPPKPADAGSRVILGDRDRLVLGGTVTLRLSGRRYDAGAATPPPEFPGPRGADCDITVSP